MTQAAAPAIELKGIDKRFGAVHANRAIDLRVAPGSIHGIVGENGAGKSTLMSILYGFYQADAGDIFIKGQKVHIADSQSAIAHGIGMVHQHFMLVHNFTVLENIMLGAEGGSRLAGGESAARKLLDELERDYGLEVDPDAVVEDLPVGLQQRVEILKALFRGADILILDEPTGVLTPTEADHLFRILRQLREQGKTIILITHKLREIMAVTDTVSVMRRGEMVESLKTSETSIPHLAELMVGRKVLLRVEKNPPKRGGVVLSVEELNLVDQRGVAVLSNVSFKVLAGEIVGIAGVAGNGQSELLEVLAGMRKPSAGSISLHNDDTVTPLPGDPYACRAAGITHVPEDRLRTGLVRPFEAYESSILGYQRDPRYGQGILFDLPTIRNECAQRLGSYDVRPQDCRLKTANFSGGNQQKIVLAREMERDPRLLLVGQPTRGVDIGAIEFIHRRLVEMRDAGKAILLVSVELDEIRALADRVLVMFEGRIVGEVGPDASDEVLGTMMAGIEQEKAA